MLHKMINLEDLHDLDLDDAMESVSISWENTLLISQFIQDGATYSLVVNTDGSQLVVRRKAQDIISKFAAEMDIRDFDMRVYAKLCGVKYGIPCVAGKYHLIPTADKRGDNVTWLMAHHISTYGICHNDQLLTIVIGEAVVKIDMATAKLEANMRRAEEMGALQVAEDRQFAIRHGANSLVENQWGVPNLEESGHYTGDHNKIRIERTKAEAMINIVSQEYCGDDATEAELNRIMKSVTKAFTGK